MCVAWSAFCNSNNVRSDLQTFIKHAWHILSWFRSQGTTPMRSTTTMKGAMDPRMAKFIFPILPWWRNPGVTVAWARQCHVMTSKDDQIGVCLLVCINMIYYVEKYSFFSLSLLIHNHMSHVHIHIYIYINTYIYIYVYTISRIIENMYI